MMPMITMLMAAATSIRRYRVSVKPTPMRTKISGMSIAAGMAISAKRLAVALGRKNIARQTSSISALKRITARDFTFNEYLSDMMRVMAHSTMTMIIPKRMIPATLRVEKKLNSLGVNIDV